MTENSADNMSSFKPYLIRACYEWILDNNLTPLVAAITTLPEVLVPHEYYAEEKIVLNISPDATHKLRIGNDALEFKAKFGGVSRDIFIPIDAVLAIYARENNQGTVFKQEEPVVSQSTTAINVQQKSQPKLKIVDGGATTN